MTCIFILCVSLANRCFSLTSPQLCLQQKKVQEKCAIIGTSSSVLFSHSSGSSIDGYPVLLRMNPRPWKSLEAYLGYRKGIAIVDKPFWETHSKYLVHTHDLVILVTDAVQSQMDQNSVGHTTKLYTIHPRFLSHIENIFGKSATASDVLFPTLALALNLCRSVTLFGASPVLMPASVPAMYYDVCKGEKVDATMSNKTIVWRQLKYFVELGLVKLGEPCIFECTGNQNGENKKCVSCRSQNGVQPNISLNC